MTAGRVPRFLAEHLQGDRPVADFALVDNGRKPPPSGP